MTSETELMRANIRGEMARRGMTQEDIAKAIGCERPLANKKLTGKKDFTVSDLEKIADMFGMTLFQFTAVLLQPIDSKTYNKDLRKACVEAVFDEFAEHGDMIRPQYAGQWDEIDASRFLGHITGPMDIDVTDLVDVIIDTIVKEAQK